ncbi:protease inhibitor I9 family protein [Eikenella sp. S3360]|uniref:Protease inhibitor I9 family protein n=1 Tax=Eikenella glucosivorans TaxID=2766967 RepID=A0ABS0N767_9NEIS|nr:protease inhibitor I9 family protein [Eikenella glucosivorans]MBH5328130.1 protease inhibitor I9 family protein [Eikenella glucosivorans]
MTTIRHAIGLACLAALAACTAPQPAPAVGQRELPAPPANQTAADNRVLIIFYDAAAAQAPRQVLQTARAMRAELVYRYENLHGFAVRIPPQQDLPQAAERFKRIRGVLSVERDQTVQLHQ